MMDMGVLLLVVFVCAGFVLPGSHLGDPDLWWHLANARATVAAHHPAYADAYSFTVAGQPWVDPEWLSEIFYWLGFSWLGLPGISLVTLTTLGANVIFLYWRSTLQSRHAGVALWTGIVGILLMTVNSGPRMILFGYLALNAELSILERAGRGNRTWIWLLLPLFCIWVNLHGSWFIGFAVLVLYVVCNSISLRKGAVEQHGWTRGERLRWIWVSAGCAVAVFINPYGWRLVWNPFDMAFNQSLNIASVQEWQPLSPTSPVGLVLLISIVVLVVANLMRPRKWALFELGLLSVAWIAAFTHQRFTFLAAVLTIPILTFDAARAFFPPSNPRTVPAMNALLGIGAVCVVAFYLPSRGAMELALHEKFPMRLIASIQPGWRTIHPELLGGMMALEGKPNFVDTRWDIFEHHGVMRDFISIMGVRNSLELLDRYGIDHAVLNQDQPLAYLLLRTPGWVISDRELAGETHYILLVRSEPGAAVQATGH